MTTSFYGVLLLLTFFMEFHQTHKQTKSVLVISDMVSMNCFRSACFCSSVMSISVNTSMVKAQSMKFPSANFRVAHSLISFAFTGSLLFLSVNAFLIFSRKSLETFLTRTSHSIIAIIQNNLDPMLFDDFFSDLLSRTKQDD